MKRRTLRRVLLLGVVVLLLYPFQTRVVPAWRVQVVDDAGQPVPHATVNYSWRHASIEWQRREERTRTDENGWVSFPERRTRASLLQRIGVAVLNVPWIMHVDWGPHGHIVAWGKPGYDSSVSFYDGKKQMPEQIVLYPMKTSSPIKDGKYLVDVDEK